VNFLRSSPELELNSHIKTPDKVEKERKKVASELMSLMRMKKKNLSLNFISVFRCVERVKIVRKVQSLKMKKWRKIITKTFYRFSLRKC
jgi:hypothetical protein